MRTRLIRFAVLAASLNLFASSPTMAAETPEEAIACARRELEIAKIQYRLYWQVDHKREVRELNAAIRLTEAEVDALKERVRHYKRIDEFRYQRPLLETLQKAELALLEAELRLKGLWEERNILRRSFGDRCRLMELQIAAARARVIELERARVQAE